jgi:hypothetical protein
VSTRRPRSERGSEVAAIEVGSPRPYRVHITLYQYKHTANRSMHTPSLTFPPALPFNLDTTIQPKPTDQKITYRAQAVHPQPRVKSSQEIKKSRNQELSEQCIHSNHTGFISHPIQPPSVQSQPVTPFHLYYIHLLLGKL